MERSRWENLPFGMVEGRNPRIDTIHANFAHVDKNKNFMITEIKNKIHTLVQKHEQGKEIYIAFQ